jgi:uncharacterized phage-associated protein
VTVSRTSEELIQMFRDQKTREAVSHLLIHLGGKSTYGAITKLLYIADRQSLQEQGRPITGDQMYALPQGPILSVVLDRMNGSHPQYSDLIKHGPGYEVTLLQAEDPKELTYSDIRVLDEVLQRYGSLSWEELKAITHEFPEWKKYDKGQDTWSIISLDDVADALGFSDSQRDALISNIRERNAIVSFFSSLKDPDLAAI